MNSLNWEVIDFDEQNKSHQTVTFQCQGMIENKNTQLCFLKHVSAIKGFTGSQMYPINAVSY